MTDAAGAAALRPLRVPAERARPLRRRRPAHAARVRRRAASPTAGLAELARTFEGAWPYLDADRRREPASPIRSTRAWSRRTGSATSCSTACGRPSSRATSTSASAAGSAVPRARRRRRSRPARCRTTASTSSPSIRGSACCAPASSTSRSASSTSAGRRRRSCSRSTGDAARRCSRGRSLWDDGRCGSATPRRERVRWRDGGLAFVARARAGRPRLAALGLRLRRPLAGAAARRSAASTRRGLAAVNAGAAQPSRV